MKKLLTLSVALLMCALAHAGDTTSSCLNITLGRTESLAGGGFMVLYNYEVQKATVKSYHMLITRDTDTLSSSCGDLINRQVNMVYHDSSGIFMGSPDGIVITWVAYNSNQCYPNSICGKVSSTLQSTETAVVNPVKAPVTFYPNPVTDVLNLSSSTEYSLYSIDGKLLEKGTTTKVDFKYPAGTYFLKLDDAFHIVIKE